MPADRATRIASHGSSAQTLRPPPPRQIRSRAASPGCSRSPTAGAASLAQPPRRTLPARIRADCPAVAVAVADHHVLPSGHRERRAPGRRALLRAHGRLRRPAPARSLRHRLRGARPRPLGRCAQLGVRLRCRPAGRHRLPLYAATGLRSLAGAASPATRPTAFDTGGPAIRASMPNEGDPDIDADQAFILALDAPVEIRNPSPTHAVCTVEGLSEQIPVDVLTGEARASARPTPPARLRIFPRAVEIRTREHRAGHELKRCNAPKMSSSCCVVAVACRRKRRCKSCGAQAYAP